MEKRKTKNTNDRTIEDAIGILLSIAKKASRKKEEDGTVKMVDGYPVLYENKGKLAVVTASMHRMIGDYSISIYYRGNQVELYLLTIRLCGWRIKYYATLNENGEILHHEIAS